ncbi:MAG: TonB-dependent receptor [Magnetospirillum sp.]|nr:TonB-dependent receptor [Magnetospirillum sp.]
MRVPVIVSSRPALFAGTAVALILALMGSAAAQSTAPAQAEDEAVPEVVVTDSPEQPEGSAESGYRATTATIGPLGKAALKDTPYSLNVTSGELIENSNAHTLGDALKTNPTATLLMSPNTASSMTRMMVRGFTAADQSEMRDGLVDRSFSFPPLENVERIEVLNGFSGFLYGFSALGGSVNYVSKQPTETPLASLALGNYGGGINYVHADLGGPVEATGGRLGYRFNAYREDGETFIDGSDQERTLVSARLHYKLAPDSKVWADLWRQQYHAEGLQSYFALGAGVRVPDAAKFDASRQYGQDWTYNKAEKTVAGAGFDTRLNDVFSLRAGYRYGYMWRRYAYVSNTLLNDSGTYSETAGASPQQYETTHSEYALVDANVKTWDIGHTITAGYSGTDYFYIRGANDTTAPLGTSTIGNPVTYAQPALAVGGKTQWQKQYFDSYLIGDRIALTDSLSALIGVNHAVLKQMAWGSTAVISNSNFTKKKSTPSYALIYKPAPDVSTYASYMEALVGGESSSAAGVTNRYQVLPPSVSKQYEVGAKATFGGIDVNTALFRIDKVNSEVDPADNTFKQDGREIHQGLEVTASGKLTDRLTLVGGVTWMDAFIDKAVANPATQDKIPVNVPEKQARLYLEYALPFVPDLTVTGGANYYGKRPVNPLNTDYIDAATTVDAGLRYQPEVYGHKVDVNLTVANVFDTATWAYYRSGDGLLLGAPRVVSLSLKTTW